MTYDPLVNFPLAEKPLLANLVGGHPLVANPLANGFICDRKVVADISHLEVTLDVLFSTLIYHGILHNKNLKCHFLL